MQKSSLLPALLLLSVITPVELSEKNETLLLSPSDLQEVFEDLEKLWTTEANEVLPADPVYGIQLKPSEASIGLVGQKTKIQIIVDESHAVDSDRKLILTSENGKIFRVLTKEIILPGKIWNGSEETGNHLGSVAKDETELNIVLLGFKPGRARLSVQLLWAYNSSPVADSVGLFDDYEVWVVQPVNVLTDALVYVLLSSQVMTMLMLAFRMRSVAMKSILLKPCALLAALTCQAILMPMVSALVSVGVSVVLSLPVHAVICLLILGCCPAGMLASILAVLQQAHVELALLLGLLESTMAFGIMPLWLFTYSNFLGLEYEHIAGQYYYLAGSLGVVAGPLLVGLIAQRCAPRALPGMDRAIPPTCALMLLVQLTVSSISFTNCWEIATWRLLLGGALVPLCGSVIGVLTTAIFRQRLPQIKTVAIVTGLQNTVLAKAIIQMSYPASDAGVMVVMLTCIDFATLLLILITFLPHCCLWFCWTKYRPLHDHAGIGGLDHSLSDKIVKSMIKAGEITFGKLQQSSPRLNNLVNAFDYQSARSTKNLTSLGSLAGKQLFISPFNKLNRNPFLLRGKPAPSTVTSGFSLRYFNGNSGYPCLPDSPTLSQKSDKDSLQSIDYEMLGFRTGADGFHHADPDLLEVSPCSSFDEVIKPNICSRMSGQSYQSSFQRQIISDSERDSGFCAHNEEMSPIPGRSSSLFPVMDVQGSAGSRNSRTGNADVFHTPPPPSPTIDTQDTTVELSSIDEGESYTTSLDRLNQLRISKRMGTDNFNILSY